MKQKARAVLTADIVNSSLLGKGQWNSLLKSFEKAFRSHGILFDFFRGDSFYALCDAQLALRVICLLRTLALGASKGKGDKEVDVRAAIGIGKVEANIKDLGTAKGEAFILSGREMDRMGKEGPRLSIRCTNDKADAGLAVVALFSDYLLRKMTVKQSQVIHELLLGSTQVEAAKKLQKSQSTVNKHAHAADWNELAMVLKIYEKLVIQI